MLDYNNIFYFHNTFYFRGKEYLVQKIKSNGDCVWIEARLIIPYEKPKKRKF